jgi:hypothetical protein
VAGASARSGRSTAAIAASPMVAADHEHPRMRGEAASNAAQQDGRQTAKPAIRHQSQTAFPPLRIGIIGVPGAARVFERGRNVQGPS